eukprot:TRINITY_DN28264_c0_g1_i1.p2 TRINITY_DN28264_c0_g1~~TRINITY_DN28264_c0_g1_i1.p2  ORF type:complete len:543 (+),score=236.90 TRINITY_DN28264_c0_g1_i1:97-1725(+)
MSTSELNGRVAKFGVRINAPVRKEHLGVLTEDAVQFLAELHNNFEWNRRYLLRERQRRQHEINQGVFPNFLPHTKHIRESNWKVAPIPADLQDRRVEITGPTNRKMVINALNCGAKVFMADFEDANSPTWDNGIEGQQNLIDAVRRTISWKSPEGKEYTLNDKIATLMVRPRGWHMTEYHFLVNGEPISGSLFDFGLFFFHNAKALIAKGSGPYFYLPKMESHVEARLWNDVFTFAQQRLGIPYGTIRATVLIETALASFEMDEILYELRHHSAGLNCGRWDYIFSFIKKFYNHSEFVLPDRALVTMTEGFMAAYVELLIHTCHKRGIHAMGGMAAQIPVRNNDAENAKALEKVAKDKLREVKAGHDGTWVAHPGLLKVAMDVFNEHMPKPNQIYDVRPTKVTAADLLRIPSGPISLNGLRDNIRVTILYVEAWLRGSGAVPINNLMEDLATAEISRGQVQQQLRHRAKLSTGDEITPALVSKILDEETSELLRSSKEKDNKIALASEIFARMLFHTHGNFGDFMSEAAYPYILTPALSPKL